MKILLEYLNAIPTDEREAFAAGCGTSFDYLRQIGYGNRTCQPLLAVSIERATRGAVFRQAMFPDTWKSIWPELDAKEVA